jgi:hypothetical protein
MLDTFIKNKGNTKTIIHNKNKNYYSEIKWDADYDGENANLSLDIDDNGTKGHIEMKMDNDELAELLNIPSENKSLDKRLYHDFLSKSSCHDYHDKMIEIELPNENDMDIHKISSIPKSILYRHPKAKDSYEKNKKKVHFETQQMLSQRENELEFANDNIFTHISSPTSQEEIIFPLVVSETKTRKRRHHGKPKTHVTHKIYRKNRKSSGSSSSSRKTLRRHKSHGHHGHHAHYSRRTF